MTARAADPVRSAGLAQRAGRWVLPLVALAIAPALWRGSVPMLAVLLPAALLLAVVQVVWQDIVSFSIADGPIVAIGLIGAVTRLGAGASSLDAVQAAIDLGSCGGALWLCREVYYRRRGRDGIGMGDVKLAAAGGLLVGFEEFAWALLLASLAGLALVVASRLSARPLAPADKLPFGAFLAPALLAVWMAGPLP